MTARVIAVPDDSVGLRADVFISKTENISRSRVQKLIEDGSVTCSGIKRKNFVLTNNYKLCAGDVITVIYPDVKACDASPEDIPLDIVYEDDDIIVINKPKGMVVHPAVGNQTGTLVNALLAHCALSGIGGVARPGIVHRIDKKTSGLLVVAKNDASHISLSAQIKHHDVKRIYRAVVIGKIESEMTLDFPIGRSTVNRKKMAVTEKNSRPAITHIKPLESLPGATYIQCELETGRTHQIRVHMAHIGHPVLGDEIYGGIKNPVMAKYGAGLDGQCLHAAEISFTHPTSGKQLRFTADLPDYFKEVLRRMRQ